MKKKWNFFLFNKEIRKILMIMKLITFFLLVGIMQLTAGCYSQNTYTISMENVSLEDVMSQIKKNSDYYFLYKNSDIASVQNLNIDVSNASIEEILTNCLKGTDLSFSVDNNIILVKKSEIASEAENFQEIEVKGKVTDSEGTPLPGATILIKGTLQGVTTNTDGTYNITVPNTSTVLKVSFIGFTPQEISVGDKTEINVVLEESATNLKEVVVTGYQKVAVERSTGSAVTITSEDIENKGQSNLMNSLEGTIAGLGVFSDPSSEGSKKINIRGIATIEGDSQPLIVIDGFPVETTIDQINPYDVESVTVLKDAGASSIYGARAANGVIVITTKRGKKGNLKVSYTNNFTFNARPDIAYRLNRVSSSELVDLQIIGAEATNGKHTYEWYYNNTPYSQYYTEAKNLVYHKLAELGEETVNQEEVDAYFNNLRTLDNTNQLKEFFTQNPYTEQHNLTMSGGSDKNLFRATINYTKTKSSFVGDNSNRVIFDLQNNTKFNKYLKFDLSANISFNENSSIPFNRDILLDQVSSYEMFMDADGNPLPVTTGVMTRLAQNGGITFGKDPFEIQRLINMGLYDESYYPLKELNNYSENGKGINIRLQGMLYADFTKGLEGVFGFKYESSASKNIRIAREGSFEVRHLVNNLSPIDYAGNDETLNIPRGARYTETRNDSHAYTLRAQLNYDKSFGDHNIRALVGSEVREVFSSGVTTDQYGYDESSLLFKYVDKNRLANSQSIQDLNISGNRLNGGLNFADRFSEVTNRYFSLYGNFAYDYNQKYVFSGSMRIDQSNLFGTDPRYRYKPFWSLGTKWNVNEEEFFKSEIINRLAFRSSYGINGNIANNYGPFDIATLTIVGRANNVYGLGISNPALSDLRWERTATFNFGTDISLFDRKLNVSLDYYIKNTNDILAYSKTDPTLGFRGTVKNDANIRNTGFEVSINTVNYQKNDFSWSSTFMMRYNKNKVQKVFNEETSTSSLAGRRLNLEGHPANSLFLYDWKGINEDGNVMLGRSNGETFVVENGGANLYDVMLLEDLVDVGTIDPKFTGSLTNNLSYKNFSLSFMFVYSFGNILLKDSYNGERIESTPYNVNADAALAWKEAGDELYTDVPMVHHPNIYTASASRYSTRNIIDGGFIRLRELIFTYTLPSDALSFLSIKRASLNFRANNLLLIANNDDGIDPESHGFGRRYFPVKPSYSFGINIDF